MDAANSAPIETDAVAAKSTAGMLGGITVLMSEPDAVSPAENPYGYPAFSIWGIWILLVDAASARAEPLIHEKPIAVPRFTYARLPGNRGSSARAKS